MAKNNKNNDVYKEIATYRLIGCLICLVALITAFFVGFFVGKSINKNNDVKASTNVTLTSDSNYLLNGAYQFNNLLDLSTFTIFNHDYEFEFDFKCDIDNDGNLENFDMLDVYVDYNATWKCVYFFDTPNGNWPMVYTWDKFDGSSWLNETYKTIYIDNQTVSADFYNWFINNTTIVTPPVTTYNIVYRFNNVISNGFNLPNTVDDDKTYILDFRTNGLQGYFPISDFIDVFSINCDISTISYGNFDNGSNLHITINNIIGDVLISFNGESILEQSTIIYFTGNIEPMSLQFDNLDNCDYFVFDEGVIIYPFDLSSQYVFTVDILDNIDVLDKPVFNIINGSNKIVYNPFTLTTDNEYDNFISRVVVRPNNIGCIMQLRIFASGTSLDEINVSFVDWLATAVGGFFDFYIMPGLSLGLIFGSIIVLAFAVWVIRVFMGG